MTEEKKDDVTSGKPRVRKRNRLVIAGCVILCLIVVYVLASFMLRSLALARESARQGACAGNMKQVALVLEMFSERSEGNVLPELSSEPGRLMFSNNTLPDGSTLCPGLLSDPASVMVCPSCVGVGWLAAETDPDVLLDDHSYFYLGYEVTSDDEMRAFAVAYKKRIKEGLPFNEDLAVDETTGKTGLTSIPRLRKGAAGGPTTDARPSSEIPVFWDTMESYSSGAPAGAPAGSFNIEITTFNHVPGGANVLYLDGHVEFVLYPSKFPVTQEAIKIMTELDALGSPYQRTQG